MLFYLFNQGLSKYPLCSLDHFKVLHATGSVQECLQNAVCLIHIKSTLLNTALEQSSKLNVSHHAINFFVLTINVLTIKSAYHLYFSLR